MGAVDMHKRVCVREWRRDWGKGEGGVVVTAYGVYRKLAHLNLQVCFFAFLRRLAVINPYHLWLMGGKVN